MSTTWVGGKNNKRWCKGDYVGPALLKEREARGQACDEIVKIPFTVYFKCETFEEGKPRRIKWMFALNIFKCSYSKFMKT